MFKGFVPISAFILSIALSVFSQPSGSATNTCGDSEAKSFDWQIGIWQSTDGKSIHEIKKVVDGCVIQETWKVEGKETAVALKSFDNGNHNRTAEKKWFYSWTASGFHQLWEGRKEDGQWRFYREWWLNGAKILSRTYWTRILPDRIERIVEQSRDAGKTWKPWVRTGFVRISELPKDNASHGLLVVSNNGDNQVLLVEPDTFNIVAALPIGINPHDLAVSPDSRFAYVAIMGTEEAPGNTIAVVDLKLRLARTVFDLGKYNRCHDVRVSGDGKLLWTTCSPSKAVLEIATENGRILKSWNLADDGAWMLVVTPDEDKIYTANLEGKSVSVINRRTNEVRSLKFDSGQIGIDVSPNGREVWVHHIDSSEVSVIDVATDRVLTTFPSGGKSFGRLKFTPDGKYVLVPQGESKNMTVFDATTRRMVAEVKLSAPPKVITVSADSKRAFITSPTTNQMLVIDLTSFKEIKAVPMGKNTDGIAWASVTP